MKPNRTERTKLPIINWLFFLFLSSGISVFQDHFKLAGQINPIEQIDTFSAPRIVKSVRLTRLFPNPTIVRKDTSGRSANITSLSKKLNRLTAIGFIRQSVFTNCLPQNIILHFRSRNLTSRSSEHPIDFIS